MTVYNILPMGKPRMTRADKWKKRPEVMRYRAFCDHVRLLGIYMPESNSHVTFVLPMPNSWSKKKRAEMNGQPHQGTTIRGVMGAEARITSGSLSGVTLRGVFDDPENIGFAEAGIRIDGTRPTFFVNSSDVSGLERLDTLKVNGREFWVDRVGPDDCGSCHVWLGSGSPPGGSRRR